MDDVWNELLAQPTELDLSLVPPAQLLQPDRRPKRKAPSSTAAPKPKRIREGRRVQRHEVKVLLTYRLAERKLHVCTDGQDSPMPCVCEGVSSGAPSQFRCHTFSQHPDMTLKVLVSSLVRDHVYARAQPLPKGEAWLFTIHPTPRSDCKPSLGHGKVKKLAQPSAAKKEKAQLKQRDPTTGKFLDRGRARSPSSASDASTPSSSPCVTPSSSPCVTPRSGSPMPDMGYRYLETSDSDDE